ncbi:MAG: NUDIX domain-containing protein [Thermoleophilaceae bacterium]|nr:NUDIX domain-containing protein [Thermoleophilaceae bacterium]
MDSTQHIREALLSDARKHKPHDEAERRHQLAMIDWLSDPSTDGPFDRNVFDPGHATGSCFVVGTDGRAALIFHKNLKLWVQPGGHAEPGESDPAVVSAREAEEELGISLGGVVPELFDLDVHRIGARGGTPAHFHFDFRTLAVIEPAELAPATDAAEARWLTRAEISAIGVDVGVRRMADKAVLMGLLASR